MNAATGAIGSRPIFSRVVMAPSCTALSCTVPSCTAPTCTAPTCMAPSCAAPHFTVPAFVVPLVVVPLLTLLFGVAFSARAATPEPRGRPSVDWERLIRTHLARYPLMEPADLYKLLHQAALGSEHAVRDTLAAREWLERELASMGPGPAEPLVDSLRSDGSIVRIHLRPFAVAGGDPEALLQAFIGTGAVPGDREDLRRAGKAAVRLARAKGLPWPDSTVSALFAGLAAQGYPAVHHSAVFVEHYRPAYRVVAGALLRGVLPAADPKSRRVTGS